MKLIKQPRIGGMEDSIYSFEQEVIALLGDTQRRKRRRLKGFPFFFLVFTLNSFGVFVLLKVSKYLVWF